MGKGMYLYQLVVSTSAKELVADSYFCTHNYEDGFVLTVVVNIFRFELVGSRVKSCKYWYWKKVMYLSLQLVTITFTHVYSQCKFE